MSTRINQPHDENIEVFAHQFDAHAREAEQRTQRASALNPDLWNQVRSRQSARLAWISDARLAEEMELAGFERTRTMSTLTFSASAAPAPVPHADTERSRISRFTSIAVTLLMVLTIAGGGYLTLLQNRPGGGDPGRFAAMVESPQASPSAANGVCDVEPLTVDEAVGIVLNPSNRLADIGAENFQPVESYEEIPRSEVPDLRRDVPMSFADEEHMARLSAVATEYLNCLRYGTAGQVWALTDPAQVQIQVLTMFPVIRSEADITSFVDRWIHSPHSSIPSQRTPPFDTWFWDQGYDVVGSDEPESIVLLDDAFDPQYAYIGMEVVSSADGSVIGRTSGNPMFPNPTENDGSLQSPGVLIAQRYSGTEVWFVRGFIITE